MRRAGEGGEGGEGAGGAEVMAWGPVGAVPVGGGPGKSDAVPSVCGQGAPAGTGPGGERSLVVANISLFFLSSPDLISYVSNLVWVFRGVVLVFWAFSFEKALKAVGVSHDVQRAQMCVFLSVRGSVLLMKCSRGQVHDSSVSAWTQSFF